MLWDQNSMLWEQNIFLVGTRYYIEGTKYKKNSGMALISHPIKVFGSNTGKIG